MAAANARMTVGNLLGDASICTGIAAGLVSIARAKEIAVFFWSPIKQGLEINRLRSAREGDKELLGTAAETARVNSQSLDAVQRRVTIVESDALAARRDAEIARTKAEELANQVSHLQPIVDGAMVYIHALTAYALRIQKILRRNKLNVGIDENLPSPPNVLLHYLPAMEDEEETLPE